MRNAKAFTAYAICFLALSLILAGCAGDKKDYLSTPEKTINTYLAQARTLSKMADPIAYSKVIDCFGHDAAIWWADNANNLLEDKSIVEGFSGNKREAVVFAKYVLPRGPAIDSSEPIIKRISMSGQHAIYKVNGVKIPMIKEGSNWRFESLFDLQE